jgi:hypothetical protein
MGMILESANTAFGTILSRNQSYRREYYAGSGILEALDFYITIWSSFGISIKLQLILSSSRQNLYTLS